MATRQTTRTAAAPRKAKATGKEPAAVAGTYDFEPHRRELQRYLRSRVRCNEDAQDLAQEILFKLSKVRAIENPKAYLFRAAQNALVDYYLERRSREEVVTVNSKTLSDLAKIRADEGPGPQKVYEQSQNKKAITAALQGLPERQREVFVLLKLEEWKTKEVAAEFGTKSSTVRQQLSDALVHLVDTLTVTSINHE